MTSLRVTDVMNEIKTDNELQKNKRRQTVWYKNWERLLSKGVSANIAIDVWSMINSTSGFRYGHVAISALHSLALAIEDKEVKK